MTVEATALPTTAKPTTAASKDTKEAAITPYHILVLLITFRSRKGHRGFNNNTKKL